MEKVSKESTDKKTNTDANDKKADKAASKKHIVSPVHNTSDGEMPDPSEHHGPEEKDVRKAFNKKNK
jgi:hypothetical protein